MSSEPKHGTSLEQQVSGAQGERARNLTLDLAFIPVCVCVFLSPQFADLGLSEQRDSRGSGDRRRQSKGKLKSL